MTKLSYGLLQELREFLDKQEAKLADSLLLAAIPTSVVPLPLHGTGHLRLAQALERMSVQIRKDQQIPGWKAPLEVVNGAFWEYVEVLESAAGELIERIHHSSMTVWNDEFYYVVLGFKELLVHRIEDLIWVFRRIEGLFFSVHSSFRKLFKSIFTLLDKSILNHLFRTEEALHIQAQNFTLCFNALRKSIEESRINETKLLGSPVFPSLPGGQQETLLFILRFLKVYEENKKHPILEEEKILTTLKGIAKPGILTIYFREYLQKVRSAFFDTARQWRETLNPGISGALFNLQVELDLLKAIIGSYREILLRPFRFSFTQWIIGPEPRKTKDLLLILYDIDTLNRLFSSLKGTIEKGISVDLMAKYLEVQRKMEEVLHEMSQPLSSRHLIQTKAERFVECWELADELGGSHGDVEDLMTKALIKALRYDTAIQAFPSMPRFGELYMIHQGCLLPIDNLEHDKRMKLFGQVIRHVEQWLKEHTVEKHSGDLDVDEASLHEAFQNFLALIQRKEVPEKGGWDLYYQMLLDYRYLFAKFFYALKLFEGEGKVVRAHFFFVDHYLEAIEMQLKG